MAARALAALTDEFFAQLRSSMPDKKPYAKQSLQDFANDPNVRLRLRAAGLQVALDAQQEQAEGG